jgi:tight adherence protein B
VVGLTVLLLSAAFLLLLAGLVDLASGPMAQRQAVGSVLDADETSATTRRARGLDRWFRGTRLGRFLDRELALAGIKRSPMVVAAIGILSAIGSAVLLWNLLAPVFSVLGMVLGAYLVRWYIRRAKDRRLEAFIAQMPEIARVLANATHAGLSIQTAIAIAGDELDEPAKGELQQVSVSLSFGNDIESALEELRERLPSREVGVLMTTLLVSARSGGSLVTSLRTIADTLESRRQTRREIRSTLAQALSTGYTMIGLTFGMLLLLNAINPRTVELMTQSPIGIAALVFAGTLDLLGFIVIRRMARIEA